MLRRLAVLCWSCALFGSSLGCYGTLSGTVSHRHSPGGGVSAAVDGMLMATEVGYSQHSGGEQPKIHSLRAAMAIGYPLLEPHSHRITVVPRIYYGVDRSVCVRRKRTAADGGRQRRRGAGAHGRTGCE